MCHVDYGYPCLRSICEEQITMNEDQAKVLTTPDYLRVLRDEQKLTFAVIVNGHESHHQISILEYDTREKIEQKMAETMVQVREELELSGNHMRGRPISSDVQSLIDAHMINK